MGIDLECPMCFACRYFRESWDAANTPKDRWNKAPLHRAHIIAHASGGGAEPDNLVLLCKACHDVAPMVVDRAEMLHWVAYREHWELVEIREVVEQAARTGVDVVAYAAIPEERRREAESRAITELRPEFHWNGVTAARFTIGTRVVIMKRSAQILGLEIEPQNTELPVGTLKRVASRSRTARCFPMRLRLARWIA
jgi:hypothetical protein